MNMIKLAHENINFIISINQRKAKERLSDKPVITKDDITNLSIELNTTFKWIPIIDVDINNDGTNPNTVQYFENGI